MTPLWECQSCKKKFTRDTDEQVTRHTCDSRLPNQYGFALQVGGELQPGDDLYIDIEPTKPPAPPPDEGGITT